MTQCERNLVTMNKILPCNYSGCKKEANPEYCYAAEEIVLDGDYIPGVNYYYCEEHKESANDGEWYGE